MQKAADPTVNEGLGSVHYRRWPQAGRPQDGEDKGGADAQGAPTLQSQQTPRTLHSLGNPITNLPERPRSCLLMEWTPLTATRHIPKQAKSKSEKWIHRCLDLSFASLN